MSEDIRTNPEYIALRVSQWINVQVIELQKETIEQLRSSIDVFTEAWQTEEFTDDLQQELIDFSSERISDLTPTN